MRRRFTQIGHGCRMVTWSIIEVALKGERLIVLDLVFVEVANAIWNTDKPQLV